ncbi:MAG: sigma factor-like helix-turn-helix DNA-binding protein [Candidatus Gracilibacteria bacterium]
MANSATSKASLDLKSLTEDLFLVLTPKEKEVVVKRFSIETGARYTLEQIGKKFGVTRERVRQIEKIALNKLRRTAGNTPLKPIANLAFEVLNKNGGVVTEEKLINEISKTLGFQGENDGSIIKLTIAITPSILHAAKSETHHPYYHLKNVSPSEVENRVKKAIQTLEKRTDVLDEGKLLTEMALASTDASPTPEFILSAISTDVRIKKIGNTYGLMSWRHVNPKSIRDKAFIMLKKINKPLHFEEIAKAIKDEGFDKKSVTVQAVHNELIRYENFVLVGRGLYGLKEWGYQEGTVSDIIESLLAKKSPLTKQEITNGVLKQRMVKKGTISLNLQKNSQFVRIGRALYTLDVSRK